VGIWEIILISIPCWIASVVIGYKKNRLLLGIFLPWLLPIIGLLIMLWVSKKETNGTQTDATDTTDTNA